MRRRWHWRLRSPRLPPPLPSPSDFPFPRPLPLAPVAHLLRAVREHVRVHLLRAQVFHLVRLLVEDGVGAADRLDAQALLQLGLLAVDLLPAELLDGHLLLLPVLLLFASRLEGVGPVAHALVRQLLQLLAPGLTVGHLEVGRRSAGSWVVGRGSWVVGRGGSSAVGMEKHAASGSGGNGPVAAAAATAATARPRPDYSCSHRALLILRRRCRHGSHHRSTRGVLCCPWLAPAHDRSGCR